AGRARVPRGVIAAAPARSRPGGENIRSGNPPAGNGPATAPSPTSSGNIGYANTPTGNVPGNVPRAISSGNIGYANTPTGNVPGNVPRALVDTPIVATLPYGVTVHPAWAIFNSQLFSEQLASSIATALEPPSGSER